MSTFRFKKYSVDMPIYYRIVNIQICKFERFCNPFLALDIHSRYKNNYLHMKRACFTNAKDYDNGVMRVPYDLKKQLLSYENKNSDIFGCLPLIIWLYNS
jgi:hypothetical protein